MKRTPARNPARLKLPIGIQSFRRLREGGHHYVDKTADIARLVDEGSAYFLSRPRRFGKSLLVDTLRHLFEGREVLFRQAHPSGWHPSRYSTDGARLPGCYLFYCP